MSALLSFVFFAKSESGSASSVGIWMFAPTCRFGFLVVAIRDTLRRIAIHVNTKNNIASHCGAFHSRAGVMKSSQINVRLTEALREDLEHACAITGLDSATVVRACLEAFVAEVKRTGEIRLPLAVIPKSETKKSSGAVLTPRSSSAAPTGLSGERGAPRDFLEEEETPRSRGASTRKTSKK